MNDKELVIHLMTVKQAWRCFLLMGQPTTNNASVIFGILLIERVWNELSGEPPWRLTVGSRTSSLTPSLCHGASHTVDGTVCENGGSKDLAIASDRPWWASAACRHSSTSRQPSSTLPTGIYVEHPVPLLVICLPLGVLVPRGTSRLTTTMLLTARGCGMSS